MATIKEQKRQEAIAKSQAAGAATKAAKEAAATQQKRTALEKGGRFREGSNITTVIKGTDANGLSGVRNEKGGIDFSQRLDEKLTFQDRAEGSRVITRKIRDDVRTSEDKESRLTQFQEDTSERRGFTSEGEVSAPPLTKKQESNIDNLLGKNISFDRLFEDPDVKQGIETFKNLGRDILKDPFLLGSQFPTPQQKEGIKLVDEGRIPTSFDFISEGKFKETFEKPGFRGSIAAVVATGLSPIGGTKLVKETPIAIELLKRQKTILNLEKELILPGQSQKLPSGKLTGVGEEVVITGGGVEGGKQIPIFVTRFKGQRGKVEKKVIIPSQGTPLLTPSGSKIVGKIDPVTQKELGVLIEGSTEIKKGVPSVSVVKEVKADATRFTTNLKTGGEKRILQKGLLEGEFKEFALSFERNKPNKAESFIQSKAESLEEVRVKIKTDSKGTITDLKTIDLGTSRNIGTPSTKLDLSGIETKGGAGGTGRGKAFTEQELKTIKDFETPRGETKAIQKQDKGLEILFTDPRFEGTKTTQGNTIIVNEMGKTNIPEQSQPVTEIPLELTTGKSDIKITPKVDPKQPLKLSESLTPNLKLTETVDVILTPGQKTTPVEGFTFREDFKIILDTVPTFDLPPPTDPPINIPEEIIPEEPVPKIPVIALPTFPISSRDFDTPSPALGDKKGFFANVPQDSIIGIIKAPEITVSEGRGFSIKRFTKPRKEKTTKRKQDISFKNISIKLPKSKPIKLIGSKPFKINFSKQKPIKFPKFKL